MPSLWQLPVQVQPGSIGELCHLCAGKITPVGPILQLAICQTSLTDLAANEEQDGAALHAATVLSAKRRCTLIGKSEGEVIADWQY